MLNTLTILASEVHGHAHEGETFFESYMELMKDPAHVSVELTFLILEIVLLGLLWPLAKMAVSNKLKKEHEQLDKEHGIVHHEDHIHRVAVEEDPCKD